MGKIRNGLFTEVNPPSSNTSGSNLMLLPAWWCSLQPTRFPSPVQHKDPGNRTGLSSLPGYHKYTEWGTCSTAPKMG